MINILMSRGILASDQVYEQAKTIIKPTMKVLIVYFSFFEKHLPDQKDYDLFYDHDNEYHQKMLKTFSRYDIDENNIKVLNYYHDSLEEMLKKIKECDILYFPGGAPEEMMDRFAQKGLLDDLKAFNKIVIGSSAGAMIQNDFFHITPDKDYQKYAIYQGLVYIKDLGIEVHFQRRIKSKKALRKTAHILGRPVYVIPDDSAIIINNGEIICIGQAKKYYENQKRVK